MSAGRASPAKLAQVGHCRSPNSTSVTGARGSPSAGPCWGMPASKASVPCAPGTGRPGASCEVLPLLSTATSTVALAATVTISAPSWYRRRRAGGCEDAPVHMALFYRTGPEPGFGPVAGACAGGCVPASFVVFGAAVLDLDRDALARAGRRGGAAWPRGPHAARQA